MSDIIYSPIYFCSILKLNDDNISVDNSKGFTYIDNRPVDYTFFKELCLETYDRIIKSSSLDKYLDLYSYLSHNMSYMTPRIIEEITYLYKATYNKELNDWSFERITLDKIKKFRMLL